MTLSAKVNLPLPYVPMTLQTLVVLMIGAAYGWRPRQRDHDRLPRRGRDGAAGVRRPDRWNCTAGRPTAGYLFGFIGAAFVTGWLAERGWIAASCGCLRRWRRPRRHSGRWASAGWPLVSVLALPRLAGRLAAIHRRLAGQERAWRDADAGGAPDRRSPVRRRFRPVPIDRAGQVDLGWPLSLRGSETMTTTTMTAGRRSRQARPSRGTKSSMSRC